MVYRTGQNDLTVLYFPDGSSAVIKDYFLQAASNSSGYTGMLSIELQTQRQANTVGYLIYNSGQTSPLLGDNSDYEGFYPEHYDWDAASRNTATGNWLAVFFRLRLPTDLIRGSVQNDLI